MSTVDTPVVRIAMQVGTDAGESPIESVPMDGTLPSELSPAVQNAVLLITIPVILLVAGALTYLLNRRSGGDSGSGMSPGERGGAILMAVGGLLTGLMLVYLMLAQ